MAEAGLRGLTHRAVDARAGLPEGTCSAYLRSRSALLVALAEHVAGLLVADVNAMTSRASTHADDQEAVSDDVTALLLQWLERPQLCRAQAELSLEASRRPELMLVFQEWRTGLVEVVERLVHEGGHADPALLAAVAVAALEGVLSTATRMPEDARAEFVRAAVPLLVHRLHDGT